jgi:hypothetical protein
MVDPVEIKFDVDTQGKECVFVKFRANDGAFSEHNNPLLSYKLGGSTKTFKNPTRGTLQLNTERFNKGDIELKKDDVIAWWIGPCKHAIIMGIHCAGCGESLEK